MDNFDLQANLPFLINRVAGRVTDAFSEELKPFDIGVGMWRVLAVLRREPSIRMGELAQATCIEISTLSRQITAMQQKGLIKRLRCQQDARAVELELTPRGWALSEQLVPIARRFEAVAIRNLLSSDVAHFRELLAQIFDNCAALQPKHKPMTSGLELPVA